MQALFVSLFITPMPIGSCQEFNCGVCRDVRVSKLQNLDVS
jgi:hypothetical protein